MLRTLMTRKLLRQRLPLALANQGKTSKFGELNECYYIKRSDKSYGMRFAFRNSLNDAFRFRNSAVYLALLFSDIEASHQAVDFLNRVLMCERQHRVHKRVYSGMTVFRPGISL